MATDGVKARNTLLSYEPLQSYGACWYYVWQAYKANGASTNMGSSATAYQGWNLSSGKHPGDRNPPPGAAIWLGRRYDGNMDGDVFIAGAYDGDHAATDQASYGQTGETSIQARMNLCGREYLGWTDHVLDCPISFGAPPTPPPQPERTEDMRLVRNTDDEGGSVRFYTENGFSYVTSPSERNLLHRFINEDPGSDGEHIPVYNNLELDIINNYIQAADPAPPVTQPGSSLSAPAWSAVGALVILAIVGVITLVQSVVPG